VADDGARTPIALFPELSASVDYRVRVAIPPVAAGGNPRWSDRIGRKYAIASERNILRNSRQTSNRPSKG